jgi:hypothetical protein
MRDGMFGCWERRVTGCGSEGVMRKEKLKVKRRSSIVQSEGLTQYQDAFSTWEPQPFKITGNSEHPGASLAMVWQCHGYLDRTARGN